MSGNRCESLTADPGVVGLIPARSHTFVEIDNEIISMVILLPSAESQEGLLSVTKNSLHEELVQAYPGKKCGEVN